MKSAKLIFYTLLKQKHEKRTNSGQYRNGAKDVLFLKKKHPFFRNKSRFVLEKVTFLILNLNPNEKNYTFQAKFSSKIRLKKA
jgi:hypothetical protein